MTSRWVLCLIVVCGCALDGTVDVEETASDLRLDCEDWGCGQNSPIADVVFHDLHKYGLANRQGFRIVGFKKGATTYQIDVTAGRLYGLHATLPRLEGATLVGAIITVARGTKLYDIRVTRVTSAPYFVAGLIATMPAYQFDWAVAGSTQYKTLCSNPTYGPDTLGMDPVTAVLFEGEMIDSRAKTVANVLDPNWFNIGCAGTALAKLALMGRVDASRGLLPPSTQADKQALLKSIVADVCGTGDVFTVPHEPLTWKDDRGWLVHGTGARTLEGRWTSAGASCYSKARLDPSTAPGSYYAEMFPSGVWAALNSKCAGRMPPPCADANPDSLSGYHFVTASP